MGLRWTKPPERNRIFQAFFVSEKKPGVQKLLWRMFIISVFVLIGPGWPWTCMIGKKHNQLFRHVYTWKASQKSFFSLASFLNCFCCRAPGRSSSERNWAQGKFLSDIFPPFPSGSSLPALHSLQPPPLPILNSNHRHRVSIISAEERGSGNNHLDIVVIRIYFLHWWRISHFLSCHKTNRIMPYVL